MLSVIIYGILIFFELLGVIAGVYLLMMRLLRPRAAARFVVVIPCGTAEEDVASLLCAARMRLGMMGDLARSEVIALDCGMSEAARGQCDALCREMDRVRVCTPEELDIRP